MSEMHEDEPKRWKDDDDAPARVRDVLRAGGAVPKMPDAVRAAVLAGLPASPAPGPGAGPGAGATAVKAAAVSPAVIAASAVAAAIAVALIVWLARSETPRQPVPVPSSIDPGVMASAAPPIAPLPITTEGASARPEESAMPAPSSAPVVAVSVPRAKPSSSAGVAPSSAASSGGDTLAEESAIIGRARATLASNPSATLLAVDEHTRRFPRGELGSEREYLRISALRRLGRVDEAKTHAKSYLAKYPSSPQAPAVKIFLAETP